MLVSPGYREEEEGGREREGGTLPPPVAIHYNYRERMRGKTPGCNKRQWNQRQEIVMSQKSCLLFVPANHTKDVCGNKFAQTKRTEATTDDSCDTHLDHSTCLQPLTGWTSAYFEGSLVSSFLCFLSNFETICNWWELYKVISNIYRVFGLSDWKW